MVNFKTWLENKETIPCGECFQFAIKLSTTILAEKIIPPDKVRVVHAMVKTKWHPKKYAHAWVESRGRAYDWQMNMTRVGSIPIPDFYEFYNPTKIKKYTIQEAIRNLVKHNHYGPW